MYPRYPCPIPIPSFHIGIGQMLSIRYTVTTFPVLFLDMRNQSDTRNHSDINSIAAQQHETWATLGFLRGVSTTKRSGRAFCTRQWIELMMEIIKEASPLARSKGSHSKALVQQVSIELF